MVRVSLNFLFKILLVVGIFLYVSCDVIYCQFLQSDYILEFERVEAIKHDDLYVRNLKIVTYKYNRTTAVANASVIFTEDFNEEMRVQVQAYKFLSNEYRLFPLRFEFNFCDSVRKNDFGLNTFTTSGNFTCPLVKGYFELHNWFPDPSRFPPRIPYGRYQFDLFVIFRLKEIMLLRLYVGIKQKMKF